MNSFISPHVHTERSKAQTYKQRFRRLNLGSNSHQRRTPGFHMTSSNLQTRSRAIWQKARQRHNVGRRRVNMTGRGVKGKKDKSSRRPPCFPPSCQIYPACSWCWRCILVLSQPPSDIRTDSSAVQSGPLFTRHFVGAYILTPATRCHICFS